MGRVSSCAPLTQEIAIATHYIRGAAFGLLATVFLGCTSRQLGVEPLPGAAPYDAALRDKLVHAWGARPHGYKPRTHHLREDGSPRYTNRLFLEPSPYLKQHAHNPVNWHAWGDEAFETARRLRRPVLLSVGYSTCHWCHVMEDESFEDEEIARYINENYVAIKVDREERPDIDGIYMAAVQLMTGRGGWPMTAWLTPDRKPYYGGTYFPPRDGDRGNPTGFLTVLRMLRTAYDKEPERVAESARQISRAVQMQMAPGVAADSLPDARLFDEAMREYRGRYDSNHGGLLGAPKFPSSLPVRYLLRHARRVGDREALQMAVLTLERMAAGGIYDQVGGGFHRYSTDAEWLAPHFEKMLYDNALLAMTYLEAYQATGKAAFGRVAREILHYADREMSAPDGGFYSATDADSPTPEGERKEGWFFTWTPAEVEAALGRERAKVIESYFSVTPGGDLGGRSILHTSRTVEAVAKDFGIPPARERMIVEESRENLYAARARRPAPHRDEKVLAAWNGLMISAFARAAMVLGEDRYAKRSALAADFVLNRMRAGGRLQRSFIDRAARGDAYLEDYAFLIAGLLDLNQATGEPRWLREALALDATLERHYEDKQGGGFFLSSDDHETLLAREKPNYDGPEPSGNSVQALNLLRLYELTSNDRYRKRADNTFAAFTSQLRKAPTSMSDMLIALDFKFGAPKEIVIVTPRTRAEAEPFLARMRAAYSPNFVLVVASEGADLAAQATLVPLLEGKTARKGKPTAYVCVAGTCALPTTDPKAFAKQIGAR